MGLKVENINVSYRDKEIIHNLSFDVENGEVLGIAGINGAGKSSTLKTIVGVIPFSEGKIKLNNTEADTVFKKEYIKEKIGYCPDVGGIIPAATPREHINLLLNLNKKNANANIEEALDLIRLVNLQDFLDSPCGSFSHGMMRRMSVVLASLNAEELLILDEPFDGVDPTGIKSIQEIIARHKAKGHGVIVSSHLINVLAETADRVMIMAQGKVLEAGKASAFKGDAGFKKYAKLLGI